MSNKINSVFLFLFISFLLFIEQIVEFVFELKIICSSQGQQLIEFFLENYIIIFALVYLARFNPVFPKILEYWYFLLYLLA